MTEKVCSKCGEIKPLSEFHKNKTATDGHRSSCGECCRVAAQEYHHEQANRMRGRYKNPHQDKDKQLAAIPSDQLWHPDDYIRAVCHVEGGRCVGVQVVGKCDDDRCHWILFDDPIPAHLGGPRAVLIVQMRSNQIFTGPDVESFIERQRAKLPDYRSMVDKAAQERANQKKEKMTA